MDVHIQQKIQMLIYMPWYACQFVSVQDREFQTLYNSISIS
jgi:hypothetical protein